MIGARCADLIAEAVVSMEFKASAEDISRMSHAHPTFAEAVKEAALAATDNRVHVVFYDFTLKNPSNYI
jgi:dihydrolipoamide dehydrogenase